MTPFGKMRVSRTSPLIAAILVSTPIGGCGEDFESKLREPASIELTGAIKPDQVIVSPDAVGAGPISITISNQTGDACTVTLEGDSVREEVGPINPLDTATIQKTVAPGTYRVRARAGDGGTNEIRPADLRVGRPREARTAGSGFPGPRRHQSRHVGGLGAVRPSAVG